MNTIKSIFLLFLSIFTLVSCAKMEDTYKEFIKETIYTGKADSVKVRNGRNRIEVSWLLLSDPKISSYKMFWNNGQDSIENAITRTENVDTVRVLIENLTEDIHQIEIYHYDKNGNSSVKSTAIGHSYGERYERSLLDRTFSYENTNDLLTFVWTAPEESMIFVDVEYQDLNGNLILHRVLKETINDTIYNFPQNASFKYRTAFKPEPNALDTFYTSYKTVSTNPKFHKEQPMDMVLIYTGGAHRPAGWFQPSQFLPYLALDRADGSFDWLFDGFLFLELKDGDKSFWGNHGSIPANKEDWKRLADKFFTDGINVSALDRQISNLLAKGGYTSPFEKRKIIFSIPEPKKGQKDWGSINGVTMDFDKVDDRIAACKWYVDYIIENFENKKYKNLDLIAFYWILENDDVDSQITLKVGEYVHNKELMFYWIPNFLGLSQIYYNWKPLGFDRAYVQPGYYYRTDNDYNRLEQSYQMIKEYQLQPYVEFAENALKNNGNLGHRLTNTIDVFEKHGLWETHPMGYYQGFNGFYRLRFSQDPDDYNLYLRLAELIAKRQKNKQQ